MNLPERIASCTENLRFEIGLLSFFLLAFVIGYLFRLPTLLLFLAFCLLVISLGLLWATLIDHGKFERMGVDEALEYASLTHDEERKVAVLRGLKDLEYERTLGKISDEDYETLSRRYRKEALHLLEQLDSADAALRERVLDAVARRIGKEP